MSMFLIIYRSGEKLFHVNSDYAVELLLHRQIKQHYVEPSGYLVSRQVSALPGAVPFETRHSLFKQLSRD